MPCDRKYNQFDGITSDLGLCMFNELIATVLKWYEIANTYAALVAYH